MGGQVEPLERELIESVNVIALNTAQLNALLDDADGKIDNLMRKYPSMDLLVKQDIGAAKYLCNKSESHMDQELANEELAYDTIVG